MSQEGTVNASLSVKTGNIDFQSRPTQFRVDVAGAMGPTPGAVTVTTGGTDIDLSQLTTPGLCVIQNYDATNFVTVGKFDVVHDLFDPVMEIGPGEGYVLKLSRYLKTELVGSTGTAAGDATRLRIKADTASCKVFVGAFEK